MGNRSKQQTSQTTTTALPTNQQTNVDTLMRGALDYYNSGGRTYYPGEQVAGFNPEQMEGRASLLDFSRGGGQEFTDAALAGNRFYMDPNNIMNPDRIPGYRGAQEATTRSYTENLLENILPAVRGGGTASGQFGGSAAGIGEALAVDRSTTNMADALTRMDMDAYAQGLSTFNRAQDRAPAMFQLGAQPGTVIANVGDAGQALEQRQIDADMARHMFEQNEESNILALLQSLTGTAGQYGGTVESNSETSGSGGSAANQAAGLGLMGLSMFGGGGAGKGAGGGAGAGGKGGGGGTGGGSISI